MEINELENRENLPNQNWFFGKSAELTNFTYTNQAKTKQNKTNSDH